MNEQVPTMPPLNEAAITKLVAKTEEQEALDKVAAARDKRAAACKMEFELLLKKHNCQCLFQQVYHNGQMVQGGLVFVAK
jgi:hypothetical protein